MHAVTEQLPAPAPAAERSALGRTWVYLNSMFPPAVMVPAGACSFLAIDWSLQALAGGGGALQLDPRALIGAACVVLLMLLMRIYDELKDVESDLALGKAGDPRYADRPIVTGAVRVEDIVRLRWIVTALLFVGVVPLGPWAWAGFAVAYFACWLSFKWFFWPKIQENLLLAFATHNPLTLLVLGFVGTVWIAEFGTAGLNGWAVLLLLSQYLPVAGWETSRKLRLPDEETTYQTYSMMLGLKTASVLPALFTAGSAACLIPTARMAGLGWVYPGAVIAAAALVIGGSLRLRFAPAPGRTNLRPLMEVYAVVVNMGLVIALGVTYGVAWQT